MGTLTPVVDGKVQDKNINILMKDVDAQNSKLEHHKDKFPSGFQ